MWWCWSGPNGAGKTNCIEAISFLSPGRGLRRATLDDVADIQGDGSWAVSAEVEGALGLATLGTGIDAPGSEAAVSGRRCRIDREPVGSATAFGDHLRMVWLTPSMDGLFTGAASERRRFFDRLVLAIDSEHSARVSALDRSLRSRNRLLEVRNFDDHWCDAIERETAELAVAVAATRGQTVTRLAAMLRARGAQSAFPSAEIMLDGWMENALMHEPATAVEDRYREILRQGRARDAAAGRTLDGPHLTDLQVIYAPKNMPARDASTGEQKALLIGLVLAHASLVAEMTGITPLLLLDEVVAHLDPEPAQGVVRGTGKTRRAGLDDRRRPRGLRRTRRLGRNFQCRERPHHAARQALSATMEAGKQPLESGFSRARESAF